MVVQHSTRNVPRTFFSAIIIGRHGARHAFKRVPIGLGNSLLQICAEHSYFAVIDRLRLRLYWLRHRSAPCCKFDDVARRGAGDDRLEPPSPCVQRMAFLGRVVVAVVYRRNALDRSALVVKHGLDDVRRDANACHATGGGAAKIVKSPSVGRPDVILLRRLKNRGVDCLFRPRESRDGRLARRREHEAVSLVADAGQSGENPRAPGR